MPKTIIEAEALSWLEADCPRCTIVTSPPDAEEIGKPLPEWAEWFSSAVRACMRAARDDLAAVFYVTDRKHDGAIYSKANLLFAAAAIEERKTLWHKIALRRSVGKADIHRPTYSHMIAFGRDARCGAATPDVINAGRMLYPNATGLSAAAVAVKFAGREDAPLVDPFCGRGTIPAVAEAIGLDAIGVDIDPAQCEKARALKLNWRGQSSSSAA